jgi:ACS family hexuronate transporter-like MFS transporter
MKITAASWPVALVYIISTVGSVAGGWLPLFHQQKRMARFKSAQDLDAHLCFLCIADRFCIGIGCDQYVVGVIVIGIAAAAHQAWSANIFTTVSDMFPKKSTASVTGIGGMFGSVGGIVLSLFVQKNMFVHYRSIGHIETAYYIMFAVCAGSYLAAWIIMNACWKRKTGGGRGTHIKCKRLKKLYFLRDISCEPFELFNSWRT